MKGDKDFNKQTIMKALTTMNANASLATALGLDGSTVVAPPPPKPFISRPIASGDKIPGDADIDKSAIEY